MELHPVAEVDTVLGVVAGALGEGVTLRRSLNLDVHRVGREGGGPDLVVRVLGDVVDRATVEFAATVLDRLAGTRFPAERLATPVLDAGTGTHLFVTEYVEPATARPSPSSTTPPGHGGRAVCSHATSGRSR